MTLNIFSGRNVRIERPFSCSQSKSWMCKGTIYTRICRFLFHKNALNLQKKLSATKATRGRKMCDQCQKFFATPLQVFGTAIRWQIFPAIKRCKQYKCVLLQSLCVFSTLSPKCANVGLCTKTLRSFILLVVGRVKKISRLKQSLFRSCLGFDVWKTIKKIKVHLFSLQILQIM